MIIERMLAMEEDSIASRYYLKQENDDGHGHLGRVAVACPLSFTRRWSYYIYSSSFINVLSS